MNTLHIAGDIRVSPHIWIPGLYRDWGAVNQAGLAPQLQVEAAENLRSLVREHGAHVGASIGDVLLQELQRNPVPAVGQIR